MGRNRSNSYPKLTLNLKPETGGSDKTMLLPISWTVESIIHSSALKISQYNVEITCKIISLKPKTITQLFLTITNKKIPNLDVNPSLAKRTNAPLHAFKLFFHYNRDSMISNRIIIDDAAC